MKRTSWYPGTIKPVRKGWYECRLLPGDDISIQMDYWNGKQWCAFKSEGSAYPAWEQDMGEWRGVKK